MNVWPGALGSTENEAEPSCAGVGSTIVKATSGSALIMAFTFIVETPVLRIFAVSFLVPPTGTSP